jgi:hypothetical protein
MEYAFCLPRLHLNSLQSVALFSSAMTPPGVSEGHGRALAVTRVWKVLTAMLLNNMASSPQCSLIIISYAQFMF